MSAFMQSIRPFKGVGYELSVLVGDSGHSDFLAIL